VAGLLVGLRLTPCLLVNGYVTTTYVDTNTHMFLCYINVRLLPYNIHPSIHLYLLKNLHMTHHKAIRIEMDEKVVLYLVFVIG